LELGWFKFKSIITLEFIERHLDKPWDWESNHMQIISKISRDLEDELIRMACIPPNCNERPVFKRGGYLFWESWNDLNIKYKL